MACNRLCCSLLGSSQIFVLLSFLKQEVLESETLDAYLAKAQMPPGIDEWLKTGEVDIALAQASN
ncbi:MAG TPA: hypothetical protein VIG57_11370 [Candidatus Entotheonella sp.]